MTQLPGEVLVAAEPIALNVGKPVTVIDVMNTGDRPIQVGSHYHFFEANRALHFDRASAYGCRLAIPAGAAVRFEPGETRPVELVPLGGAREVWGCNGLVEGPLDAPGARDAALARLRGRGFADSGSRRADKDLTEQDPDSTTAPGAGDATAP
jgi:urease beta subunit